LAHILIADDEVLILMAMAWPLQAAGHAVDTASDGAEALRRLDRFPADLVIMDQMMPEMTGTEVAAAIRARPGVRQPRILIVTALDESRLPAGSGLYDGLMRKPFQEDDLLATVTSLLAAPPPAA
jgi:DNA-binding response OmpR family regulator